MSEIFLQCKDDIISARVVQFYDELSNVLRQNMFLDPTAEWIHIQLSVRFDDRPLHFSLG